MSSSPTSGLRAWAPWIAMAVVVVGLLLFGTFGQSDPTPAERAQNLAEGIRCPSCKSQAVASSDTPASKSVRVLIKQQIEAGKTDEEIRDYVDSRYAGQNLLLDPSGSGFSTLVWALPVVVVIAALAGLIYRFRDYRPGDRTVTQADRDLVAEAMAEPGQTPAPAEPPAAAEEPV